MFKRILLERADFQLIASELVKYYNVKSKIKFGASGNKADYNWLTDTIRLRSSYSTVRELITTILHEIKHAIDAKKMGKNKYEKAYSLAGELAQQKGGDFHDDNSFEEKAEKWAIKEYNKWKNKF
jgi:purine-nucleoside phosphorylase